MKVEWFVCTRYLLPKDRCSLTYLVNILAVLSIAISVMVMIVSISVMNGFESELKRRILSVDPHVIAIRDSKSIVNYPSILNCLNKIDGLKSANLVVYSQVLFRGASGISSAMIKGVDLAESIPSCCLLTDGQITFKSPLEKTDPVPIILGSILASKLGVSVGGIIYLISPTNDNKLPFFTPFKVINLLETGMYQYDETLAYLHINDAQTLLSNNNLTNCIEIKTDFVYKAEEIARKVRDKVGFTFLVRDWTQMNANLFLALKIQKLVMFIILFFITVVAALSVSSGLIMLVISKLSDVAILKSMGVSNFSIKKIFIFRGMIMGFVGSILGGSVGLFVCFLLKKYEFISLPGEVYSLKTLPVDFNFQDIFTILLTTLIICFLFSIYPAYKASLLRLVEGIMRE